MKKFRLLIWSAAICGAAVFTGCVDTADTPLSPIEQEWERAIRDSYPGYRTPKTMAPGVRDNVVYYDAPKPAVQESAPAVVDAPAVAEDPAKAVDKAAEGSADAAAPAPQEVKVEAKNDAPAADNKAVKAEDKAAAAATDVKADDKAAKAEDKAVAKADDKKGAAEAVVKAGDTIGGIAKEFYGNAKYADVILKANPQVKDAKRLKIGTKLVIPAL